MKTSDVLVKILSAKKLEAEPHDHGRLMLRSLADPTVACVYLVKLDIDGHEAGLELPVLWKEPDTAPGEHSVKTTPPALGTAR